MSLGRSNNSSPCPEYDLTSISVPAVALRRETLAKDARQESMSVASLIQETTRKIKRLSNEFTQVPTAWTLEEERLVVKKLDRRIIPFVSLLQLLSFLDRGYFLFSNSSYE